MARTVFGKVQNAGAPLGGALVQAWDEDVGSDDFMGQATTSAAGDYSLSYHGGHWDPAPHNVTVWRPDIFVTVQVKSHDGHWVRIARSATHSDHKLKDDLRVDFAMSYGPKVKKSTGFDPAKFGFHFPNSFQIDPKVLGIDLGTWDMGLCGGMSAGAAHRFKAKQNAPADVATPKEGTPLYKELLQRQITSMSGSVLPRVLEWQACPDKGHTLTPHSVGWRTKQEWPTLQSRLDNGHPTVLVLIRKEGTFANPSGNHQVLATGYEFDPMTKDLRIDVYDPNHAGKTPTLRMNFGLPDSDIDASQSTGERLRGFFVNPHGDAAAA